MLFLQAWPGCAQGQTRSNVGHLSTLCLVIFLSKSIVEKLILLLIGPEKITLCAYAAAYL